MTHGRLGGGRGLAKVNRLSLARREGVEAWTLGGAPVPALLRQAAALLEEYKRFIVHDVALTYDDAGEWLTIYGEWLGWRERGR